MTLSDAEIAAMRAESEAAMRSAFVVSRAKFEENASGVKKDPYGQPMLLPQMDETEIPCNIAPKNSSESERPSEWPDATEVLTYPVGTDLSNVDSIEVVKRDGAVLPQRERYQVTGPPQKHLTVYRVGIRFTPAGGH